MVQWIVNYSCDGARTWHQCNFTNLAEAQSFTNGLIVGFKSVPTFDYYIQRVVECSRHDFNSADHADAIGLLLSFGLMVTPNEVRELL